MENKSQIAKDRTAELKVLYRKWPEIKRYLRQFGCDSLTGEDLFQEALLIYLRKSEQPDFELTTDAFFYVRNTCKFLWYNQARKEGKAIHSELEQDTAEEQDPWMLKELKLQSVERAMLALGKQCRDLLQLFYGLGWTMTEIAKKVGLRNDKVAKAQKYRCLQKAKELVLANQVESLKA